MITKEEIHRAAAAEGLRFDQIEKDYLILWILYALSRPELKTKGWIFKGGTCLRHCYYPGYRFSEDLDFSCLVESGGLEGVRELLQRASLWVSANSGVRVEVKELFTIPGDLQIEIPLEYSRGGPRKHGLPQVKVHLTFDEPILTQTMVRSVRQQYSDLTDFTLVAYSKEEILAEKMRALIQQQKKWPRPRDLYDLWFILCHRQEQFTWEKLKALFSEKCKVREVSPDPAALTSEYLKDSNKEMWKDQLGGILKNLPVFEEVWREWEIACRIIFA